MSDDLNKKIDLVIDRGLRFLKRNFKIGDGFIKRSFYGETFTAASLILLNRDLNWANWLIDAFYKKEIKELSRHEEFNYFALQECGRYNPLIFNQFFFRKVSNWVLLRAVVRWRGGIKREKILADWQARVVLLINSSRGYVADTTLRNWHRSYYSISTQYHIFSMVLVGELYRLTENVFYKKRFERGLKLIKSMILPGGELVMIGRGRKQLFGYGSFLWLLALAVDLKIGEEQNYLKDWERIFNYVADWQKETGEVPLVLTNDDSTLFLYSYNNLFDYMPFFIFCLVKSRQLLKTKNN